MTRLEPGDVVLITNVLPRPRTPHLWALAAGVIVTRNVYEAPTSVALVRMFTGKLAHAFLEDLEKLTDG